MVPPLILAWSRLGCAVPRLSVNVCFMRLATLLYAALFPPV